MTAGAIRQNVACDGQRYYDTPVYAEVSKAKPLALAINRLFQKPVKLLVSVALPLALAVNAAYPGSQLPVANGIAYVLPPTPRVHWVIKEFSHYERTQLRWMTPDGKGGLRPKYER